MKIQEIINFLHHWAPPTYQESYDNARLLTGDQQAELTAALISLDCTEAVVDEAIAQNCNLIIAHHPIIFSGLKSLTGKNYIERTIIKAIKHDVAIFAIHTNLDNVHKGVNKKIADKLNLVNQRILAPKAHTLSKLTVFVPTENTETLIAALSEAGAGQIGNYTDCSFVVKGQGTFKPNQEANPHIGKSGQLEKVTENRVEVIFPTYASQTILTAMRQAHPYEEVAYYLHQLENENQEVGAGMIGELPKAISETDFLHLLKENFQLKIIRHTALLGKKISKVAVCGGSGSFLLPKAIAAQADVFVTSDYKYHQFFDAENKIIIADIGHFESEVFTKELIYDTLTEKFTNIALRLSEVNTNPVNYFI